MLLLPCHFLRVTVYNYLWVQIKLYTRSVILVVSTDSNTDGFEDSPERAFIRVLLRSFIDKGLEVKLVLFESDGRHYISVAQRFNHQIEGVYLLNSRAYPERHYRAVERLYGDSVFIPDKNLDLRDRPEMKVNIVGRNLTRLTREQTDYLHKNGF